MGGVYDLFPFFAGVLTCLSFFCPVCGLVFIWLVFLLANVDFVSD